MTSTFYTRETPGPGLTIPAPWWNALLLPAEPEPRPDEAVQLHGPARAGGAEGGDEAIMDRENLTTPERPDAHRRRQER